MITGLMVRSLLSFMLTFLVFAGNALAEPGVPGPKDHCPVCGMFVAKYHQWIAQIQLQDGRHVFFDGPKDMFRYYLNPSKYDPTVHPDQIKEIYVTDYYTTKQIPAREALYVVGSDVLGPMGKEMVPIKGKEKAETFLKDHHGKRIIPFDQVTLTDLPGM
jgi:copper chaperone NosL